MSDLRDLYQSLIIDHNKSPRNCRKLESANCQARGHNPVCGDMLTVYLNVENGVVTEATFEGSGCAISTASASLMTEAVKGKTIDAAKALFRRFHGMVTGVGGGEDGPELGKLIVFSGVGEYPARVKCATLAWHTVNAAMENRGESVTTE